MFNYSIHTLSHFHMQAVCEQPKSCTRTFVCVSIIQSLGDGGGEGVGSPKDT